MILPRGFFSLIPLNQQAGSGNPPPPPTGWSKEARIALPAQSAQLSTFDLWFDETATELKQTSAGGALTSATAQDVRFEQLSNGQALAWDLVYYDSASGRLVAAIRPPSVPANGRYDIRMLAGKSGATEQDMAGTWAGYTGVWFGANGTNREGTAARNLTVSGVTADSTDPWIGVYGGDGDRMYLASGSFLNGLSEIAVELYFQAAATGGDQRIIDCGADNTGNREQGLMIRHDAVGYYGGAPQCIKVSLHVNDGSTTWSVHYESAPNVHTTAWRHLLFEWKSGQLPKLYLDGKLDAPSWVGRMPASGTNNPQPNTTVTGTTLMPAGEFSIGGLPNSKPWNGKIGLVTIRPTVVGSVQALAESRNRREPRRLYGISVFTAANPADVPVVAVPKEVSQQASTTQSYDVASDAYDPDDAPMLTSVGTPTGEIASAQIVSGQLEVTAATGAGEGTVPFTITADTTTSTSKLYADVQPGGAENPALQYGGKWIGGAASQATQLRPHYNGLPYRTSTSGKARTAFCFKAPKTGQITHIAVNERAGRPSNTSDRCDGGYVSSWTDSYSNDVDTASSAVFCSSGGEYSVGDGGEIIAQVRKMITTDPDPKNWYPDDSANGLLGETAINGGISSTLVEDFLNNQNYRWWPLLSPISVTAGDQLAVVFVHKGVRDANAAVQERFAFNADMLYAADPARRGGPVWGWDWQGRWDRGDGTGWGFVRGTSEDCVSQLLIRYSDDTAYGPCTITALSASRSTIGGQTRARMSFQLPASYPNLTVDRVWMMAFRNVSSPGNLTVELKSSSGTTLATASFPGNAFSLNAPSSSDSGEYRGGAEADLSTQVTLTAGSTYYVEISSPASNEYILQAHNQDKVNDLDVGGTVTLVDKLPGWSVQRSTDGGSSWGAWPGYGETFPVIFRVVQ